MTNGESYMLYCDHCKAHGRSPHTRLWWEQAIGWQAVKAEPSDIQFDIDTERREGWAYAND